MRLVGVGLVLVGAVGLALEGAGPSAVFAGIAVTVGLIVLVVRGPRGG